MSSLKYTLTLSEEAKRDFRDILSYTLQMWGENHLVEYRDLLDHALTAIEQAPETGGDNFPPYRYAKAGKHYIFYKIERETISVSRILHGSMDFIRHLKEIT